MQTNTAMAQVEPPYLEVQKEPKKPHISQSQLNLYTSCAEAYRRRYIEGEKIPPGFALITGTGVHKGLEVNFKQKIETKTDLRETDVVDAAVTEFESRILKEGVLLTQEEETIGYSKVKGQTKDKIVRMTKKVMAEIAPKYQPKFVEESHRIEIENSPYDLLAVMDLADENGIVADFKTASKKKTQDEIDKSDQLSFYSIIYKAKTGEFPKGLRLEIIIDRELKKDTVTECQTLETTRDVDHLQSLVNRLNAMIYGIGKGVFMPCDRNHWRCSSRFCGYYNTCKYV